MKVISLVALKISWQPFPMMLQGLSSCLSSCQLTNRSQGSFRLPYDKLKGPVICLLWRGAVWALIRYHFSQVRGCWQHVQANQHLRTSRAGTRIRDHSLQTAPASFSLYLSFRLIFPWLPTVISLPSLQLTTATLFTTKRESQSRKRIFLRLLAHGTQTAHLLTNEHCSLISHFPQEIHENIHVTTK